jgi:phosphoribosyl 1,2-cyclic phosphodiesterase/CheY-like chemotaxis protein
MLRSEDPYGDGLRIVSKRSLEQPGVPPACLRAHGMKTILLIDDDAGFRSALAAFLKGQGWEVLEASDGDTGLHLARRHLPGVILCDLLMPGTNGFRVCTTVRDEAALRHAVLFAMSGKDFANTRQSALEAGADGFLLKPIDPKELVAMLERTLPRNALAPPPPSTGTTRLFRPEAFVRFWGVRGSVPTPGPGTVRYGGNTACVEVRSDEELIILDSGTGIRLLGDKLASEFRGEPLQITLLITHSHWDHVQGFPFFQPAYDPRNKIRIFGFEGTREGLAGVFSKQMESPYFPIGLGQLPGHIIFEELRSMKFNIGAIEARAAFVNHPGVCVGYRLNTGKGSVAYLPDTEPFYRVRSQPGGDGPPRAEALAFARSEDEKIVQFIEGVDLLILDAQFDAAEYRQHIGWGHTSVDDAVELALRAKARQLFLFHHDPDHNDDRIDQMLQHARDLAGQQGSKVEVHAAREGLKVPLAKAAVPA